MRSSVKSSNMRDATRSRREVPSRCGNTACVRPKAELGIFYVAMVSTAAGFSVRNLPSMAVEGWSLIFWYVLGTLLFLVPLGLTAAELASTWPRDGGVYDWVAEAFGDRTGFMSVW